MCMYKLCHELNLNKRMRVVKFLLVGAFLIAGGFTYGQEQPYQLSLAQAREYALQNNKKLMNARAGVVTSQMKVKETVAKGLPQVDGSMSYMTYFNYEMNFGMGGSSEPNINYALLDPGDFEVLGAINGMLGSSEPIVMGDQLSGKVQLSQLIFSGQYYAGIQTAKIARKLSEQNVVVSELDVKENVTNTYYQILTSEKTLKILQENINNLNTILQHTTNMYKAGVAEETDVDQLQITVNQLINTRKSLERMNQLNYNMLKFQLGTPPETNIVLTDSLTLLVDALMPQMALGSEFKLESNINYQMMKSQVDLSKKQIDISSWSYAPTLAGYFTYTGKILKSGFDMNPDKLAGVNLTVPLWSSGVRKAQLSQAKVNYDMAQRNLDMVKDQLEIQHQQVLFVYQNALENFQTQKENVSVARRVYQSMQNKYEQGLVSSLSLTQANGNLLTAESNYLQSVLTLLQAQTSMDKLYNKL